MLLIGFPIAARCSDLANLLVTDITQAGDRGLEVAVRPGIRPPLTPVGCSSPWPGPSTHGSGASPPRR